MEHVEHIGFETRACKDAIELRMTIGAGDESFIEAVRRCHTASGTEAKHWARVGRWLVDCGSIDENRAMELIATHGGNDQ